jgi:hypothetical protein
MAKKKTIKERRAEKLAAQALRATEVIRATKITEFNRTWLSRQLGVSDKEAAQIASQLKKDLVLYGENAPGEDAITGTMYRVRPVKA